MESKYFRCIKCKNYGIRLIFYPGGMSKEDINTFADQNKHFYDKEKCQVWIIGPPTDLTDEDCEHLTAKVWPHIEEPKYIRPSVFRKHIEFMEENHCNPSKTKDMYLNLKYFGK